MGATLIIGGVLGFLPILGFWMFPLGLLVLSDGVPWIRRRRRSAGSFMGPALASHSARRKKQLM